VHDPGDQFVRKLRLAAKFSDLGFKELRDLHKGQFI
jgi:hypothetical protein